MISLGQELPPTRKTVYQRALAERTFSPDSIHNDAYTRTNGYPGALVSAYVIAGYVSELMVGFFEESWFSTGSFSLSFIGEGLQQGDAITCRAKVVGMAPTAAGDHRLDLEVWIEKAAGAVPVVGKASAVHRAGPASAT